MKIFKTLHLSFIPLVLLTTCNSYWSFYPDQDDRGLSRFTSRGYNVASNYINGNSFSIMGGNNIFLQKDSSGNAIDTLKLSWGLYPNDYGPKVYSYKNISFNLPVSSSFDKNNLLALKGTKFLNSVPVTLLDSSLNILSGTGTLYFVAVSEQVFASDQKNIKLSGLFDGNIGDSVRITKGRFDFSIDEKDLNF